MVAPSNKTMGKEKSSKSATFAVGGKTPMFGRQHADPAEPFVTGHCTAGSGGSFAKGGKGHMFGQQHAAPQAPGVSGHSTGSAAGDSTGSGGGRVTKTLKAKFGG